MGQVRFWLTALLFLSPARAADLAFESNEGQGPSTARYLTRDAAGPVLIEDHALQFGGVRLEWAGTQPGPWLPAGAASGQRRYCSGGHSRALCATGASVYQRIERKNIYPGIDLILYGNGRFLEYDFRLAPGANASVIALSLSGAKADLNEKGDLRCGSVIHRAPRVTQSGKPVAARLVERQPGEFGFVLGEYRPELSLLIDPVIERRETLGGGDEDRMLGSVGAHRWGLTKSADWSGRGSWDVFVQYVSFNGGVSTLFWGGDGDEEIGAFWADANNARLRLVGSTNSRNAPSIRNGLVLAPRPAQGWDGFALDLVAGTLADAQLVGGAGDDRIYGLGRLGDESWMIAGETTQAEWPGATVVRAGRGGGIDAFVARWHSARLRLWVLGGTGSDRCRGIAPENDDWIAAGETDSPELLREAGRGGMDLWLARLPSELDSTEPKALVRFGGAADERWGGLAMSATDGLFLAGTTASPSLPAARNRGAGGRDGFVASFDPVKLEPLVSAYLGGEGDDEIVDLQLTASDLYLVGSTNSPALPYPTDPNAPRGERDALFLHLDLRTFPQYAHRHADAHWFAVEAPAKTLGVVQLSGASRGDALSLQLRFPYIQAPGGTVVLGRDLQTTVNVGVPGEPPADGLILVRSSDPERLQLGRERQPDAVGALALEAFSDNRIEPLHLYGLDAEGVVEVVLQARAEASYAERRVRVQLAPSGLYAGTESLLSPVDSGFAFVGDRFTVSVWPGPVVAGGLRQAQEFRPGLSASITVRSAEPGVATANSVVTTTGRTSINVELNQRQRTTLIPVSTTLQAAPDGQVVVDNTSRNPVRPRRWQQSQDHFVMLRLAGNPGESVVVESLDPDLVVVGDQRAVRTQVAMPSTPFTPVQVPVLALAASGLARIRVSGVLYGEPVDVVHEVLLRGFTVRHGQTLSAMLPVGTTPFVLNFSTALVAPQAGFELPEQRLRPDSPISNFRFVSSEPSVAVFNGVDFRAFRPGLTTISVEGGSAYPAVSDFRWNVEVVTPRVLIDGDELVLATGASNSLLLYNRTILAGGSFRLRSSSPAVFRMRDPLNGATSDFTTDLRSTQILTLDVFGQAGDRAALIVSFPGFPDQTIPVRLVEPTLRPEARVKTVYLLGGAPVVRARINWTLEVAGSNPQFYYPQFRDLKPTRLRISDPSICSSPPQPENSFRSSFDLECSGLGEILVSLESEWRAEPVTVRVIPGPEQAVAPEPARVGYGLQSQVYRSWATSYRSSDTSQLRLSQNQLDPGQAETRGPSVWVQGLVASGQSRLIAEGNGKREEIPVYHFPSTMVARLRENNNSPSGEVRRSLTNDAGVLSVFPMLVEPATNSLLGSVERSAGSNLSLRGGWDPFFAAITSSNPNVAATVDSRVLLTEGRGEFSLPLQLRNYGQTTISVAQPEGFTSLPASTLRLTLAPEEIRFQPVLLAPELQTRVSVYNLPAGRRVTAESLDPAQLQLAQQELGPDAAQLSFDPVLPGYGLSLYARALPAAQPGETLRIRVTVEGQPPVEIPVMIGSLRIQPNWDTVRATPPFQTPAFLGFRIGPAVGPAIDAYWDGSVRPGGLVAVDIASSDSSRLRLSGSRIVFRQSFASVPVELLRPGTVRITATPAPTSASTQALGILEAPFAIGLWQHRSSSGALLSHLITPWLTVTNPSRERATFTLRNEGAVTALLGTVGGGVPRATTLSFTLDPGQSTQISATSGGPPAPGQQNRVQVRLTAQDFEDSVVDVSPGDSRAAFSAPSPLTIPRTQAALTGQVVLGGGFNLPSFPLAAPALFEIRSSNPQVIRGGTVAFQSGEATKSFSLAVAGPGDTVLTIAPPSSLSGMRGETLLVTVR